MIVRQTPVASFVGDLAAGREVTLARYGDGEFYAILGKPGQNCDGHTYFPDLGRDLAATLTSPKPYHYAVGPMATKQPEIRAWVEENSQVTTWHSTEVFLEASLAGQLGDLTRLLSTRRTLYVGPPHLLKGATVAGLFSVVGYVMIPSSNAYTKREQVLDVIGQQVDKTKPGIIGFSAGMLSNVLIWRLYDRFHGAISMIDFGSIWDPYAGRISRSYHRKMDLDQLRQENRGIDL